MSKIVITYKAFGDAPESGRVVSSVSFEITREIADYCGISKDIAADNHHNFCELVFHDTNTYSGRLWFFLEDKLELQAPNRTHTALSVGDEIAIDDKTYRCENVGWSQVEKAVSR